MRNSVYFFYAMNFCPQSFFLLLHHLHVYFRKVFFFLRNITTLKLQKPILRPHNLSGYLIWNWREKFLASFIMAFTSSRLAFWNETKESFRKQGPVQHSKSLIHACNHALGRHMNKYDTRKSLHAYLTVLQIRSWNSLDVVGRYWVYKTLIRIVICSSLMIP